MRVFHVCAESVTEAGATGALRRLGEALQTLSHPALAAEDCERFEQEVHALFAAAEREVLGEGLTGLDVDLPCVVIDGQHHPPGAEKHADLSELCGAGHGGAYALPLGPRSGGGCAGAARGHRRGTLDTVLPKRLSERWEAKRAGFEASLRAQLVVPEEAVTLAASLDGVRVPMKDGERQAKRAQARGPRAKRPAVRPATKSSAVPRSPATTQTASV